MSIIFLNEKNSDEIREYLLLASSDIFIDEAFRKTVLKSPNSNFRHMFFAGNLIAYGKYNDNVLEKLALFYLPGAELESTFMQGLVLPKSDLSFFEKVLFEVSPLIDEEGIKKIKLRIHDFANTNDGDIFQNYGFAGEAKIPLATGTHLHMAYFL